MELQYWQQSQDDQGHPVVAVELFLRVSLAGVCVVTASIAKWHNLMFVQLREVPVAFCRAVNGTFWWWQERSSVGIGWQSL